MEQQLPHKVLPQLQVDYLPHFSPKTSRQLVEQVRRAVQLEQELPHNPHLVTSGETSRPMLEQELPHNPHLVASGEISRPMLEQV